MLNIVPTLYETIPFFITTWLIGGIFSWSTGKSCAKSWLSRLDLVFYIFLLAIFIRFIEYIILSSTLLSLKEFILDSLVLLIIGMVSYQYTRTNQMTKQYYWLYKKKSPLSWKSKK